LVHRQKKLGVNIGQKTYELGVFESWKNLTSPLQY